MRNGRQEYGGFYTQQDIRDIVRYADAKHLEVIPEIDMPGHMLVATRAYPELLLDNASAGWGALFSVPVCPCKESTYTFMEDVLKEVMTLFPSKYIHIGADEVEKTSWQASALCQEWMRKQQTTDLHDLQSYFVQRMNQFIRSKGKVAIGWDEILDGPSDPSMTVMYWRGWEKNAPVKAVQRNHKVIMTPTNPMYFDYLPNSSTLETVYGFTVVPADMPADKKHLVLGGQANVWTEMIPSRERLEFMILPRLSALAERVWTNQELYGTYQQRLIRHYSIWDKKDFRYRMPDLDGFADEQVLVDGKSVLTVHNPLPGTRVHYTTDGSTPTASSRVLAQTLTLTDTGRIRFATISGAGAKSELYQVRIKNGQWVKSLDATNMNKRPGLAVSFYNGVFANTTKMAGEVIRTATITNVQLADTIKMPAFGAKIRGLIQVPQKGIYSFYFTCDDGGVLKIADQVVIDNDGQHAPVMKSGQIALEAGYHPFHIDFIEAGGGFTLKLQYSVNGSPVQAIPDGWFYHSGQ
jgi:hexosaminidase